MGAWGPALFSDDIAMDVRDEYRGFLEDELDDQEATRRTLDRFSGSLDDPDEGPVVWLVLAITQSKLGRLDAAVADRALQIIATDEGMARWEEQGPALAARRRAALEKARTQLTGPQPPRRKLRLPKTPLQPGDVLTRPVSDDRYLLLRVARIKRGVPVMVMLDFAGQNIPALDDIAEIPDHLRVDRRRPDRAVLAFTMHIYKRIDHAKAGYTVVGNIGTRPGDEDRDHDLMYDWLDDLTRGHPGYDVLGGWIAGQSDSQQQS
jgi:hypothetical protein